MDDLFDHFKPPFGMRNRHMQSLLNSSGLRHRRITRSSEALQNNAEVYTLDGGSGIRLQGLYSKQASKSRGLAVLLHGWEGSVNSSYILANGVRLYQAGFDVFRLNFRDHGET
ncbi:MAG: alpha/beta hydrolase, partial [Xanthomonadales bacterium]